MPVTWNLKIIEEAQDIAPVEALQRLVWPGNETGITPGHVLLSASRHGGLLIGAYVEQQLVGFVFGFPGIEATPQGSQYIHYSHLLGVHPDYRSQGLGFALKRAQWQMVRHQGVERIRWTYDPLLSRNAWLNIHRLGAVSSTFVRDYYGKMEDELNRGIPSDRFVVDWWVNSQRVNHRLSRRRRRSLDLAHYLAGGVPIINPSAGADDPWPRPAREVVYPYDPLQAVLVLLEIPADFPALKNANLELAMDWRLHLRLAIEELFSLGYLVTDFLHLGGDYPRSYYVLSNGESTL